MRLDTIAVHAGGDPDPATGAVAPPIHLTTTYERAADGSYPHGYVYIRQGNPARAALERCLAALEGGAAAAAFASGAAATAAVFGALDPGDHVVAPADAYYGTAQLLREVMARWGVGATFADPSDIAQLEAALRPNTRLVWLETPSNPLLRITDLRAAADLAHRAGALCAVDNTAATPLLQRPFEHGADLVVHSATKFLGGHSDVMGGAVVTRDPGGPFERVRRAQTLAGTMLAPFDAWLVLRGVRTLAHRMRGHCANAQAVAEFLAGHPAVAGVHYPGLPDHPGHAVAARQMSGFGGVVSFEVWGGRAEAFAAAARLRLITRATSFGGVESFVEHRASVEEGTTTPESLLRLSVGLEAVEDLIEDLGRALEG